MSARIRVINHGDLVGPDTRVFYVDREGNETDISDCVTGLQVSLNVGEASSARMDVIKVHVETHAAINELVEREIKPRMRRRRVFDITGFRNHVRRYVSA